ncbi:MAG: NADH-quinone oxidoreductase subunit J [Candidatus Heimdallarchaeota archaeon]|nr:NADH-quinone oxidoreductase subunit J [Candidatus Heimdallarchaeota archaeon]
MAFDMILIPFLALSAFILFSIFKSLTSEKTMQSVYWLILMLIATGFIFLLANSEILFAYQLMVYSGGIAVLMLFAGVLTEQDELFIDTSLLGFARTTKYQLILFAIFVVDLVLLVWDSVTNADFGADVHQLGDTTQTYGQAFIQIREFSVYLWFNMAEVVFILALALLTAILGSVKLAIRETDLEDLSDEYLARIEIKKEDLDQLPGMESMVDTPVEEPIPTESVEVTEEELPVEEPAEEEEEL